MAKFKNPVNRVRVCVYAAAVVCSRETLTCETFVRVPVPVVGGGGGGWVVGWSGHGQRAILSGASVRRALQ